MKRTGKILGIISLVMAMIGTLVTTVSAAAIGDPYVLGGVQAGYWLVLGGILIGAVVFFFIEKKLWKKTFPVAGIAVVIGAILLVNVTPVEVAPAAVTPAIVWSVSTTIDSSTNQTTTDDDARTITILCKVNSTTETINNTWDVVGKTAAKGVFVTPIINFTIAPSQTEGIISTDQAVTTRATVNNPDKEFTEDSKTHDLFADASGENKKNVNWTADGTTEYELHYCTVNFGSSETVLLRVFFQQDGISTLDAGESEAFTLTIGGITYTVNIIVIAVLT